MNSNVAASEVIPVRRRSVTCERSDYHHGQKVNVNLRKTEVIPVGRRSVTCERFQLLLTGSESEWKTEVVSVNWRSVKIRLCSDFHLSTGEMTDKAPALVSFGTKIFRFGQLQLHDIVTLLGGVVSAEPWSTVTFGKLVH